MSKKPYTPFALDMNKGGIYVEVRAVMDPMIPFIDGLAVTQFGKENRFYLAIDDAIEWCRKEMQSHSREKYEKMIATMERAKKEFGEESGRLKSQKP